MFNQSVAVTASSIGELPATENKIRTPREGRSLCHCKGGIHESLEIKTMSLKQQILFISLFFFCSTKEVEDRRRTLAAFVQGLTGAFTNVSCPSCYFNFVFFFFFFCFFFLFGTEKTSSWWNGKLCKGPVPELFMMDHFSGVFTREKRNVREEENP